MSDLPERIRTRRQELRMSQEALAERCGVYRITITRWESELNRPRCHLLAPLAKALDCSVDWLLGSDQP